METVFLSLLNRSMAAGWLILAVVALRLPLKKAPRWITAALWGLVAVRLICPFSFESRFSLLPGADAIPPGSPDREAPGRGFRVVLPRSIAVGEPGAPGNRQRESLAGAAVRGVPAVDWPACWSCSFTLSSALCVLAAGAGGRPAAGQSVGLRPYSDRLYPWCAASPHLSALHHEGSR